MEKNKNRIAALKESAVDTNFVEIVDRGREVESSLEKKAQGALLEINRTAERDIAEEKNLSDGLKTEKSFTKKYKTINNKRTLVINLVNKKIVENSDSKSKTFEFDDAIKQGMIELEKELTDTFSKNIYDRLAEENKRMVLDHLVDNPVSRDKSEIIHLANAEDTLNIPSAANDDVVCFSDNGYLMKLVNKEKIKNKNKNAKVGDESALFNLVAPDGKVFLKNLDYNSSLMILEEQSDIYQKNLKDEFEKTLANQEVKTTEEIEQAKAMEIEAKMNELIDKNTTEDEENKKFAAETKEFSSNLGKPAEVKTAEEIEQARAMEIEAKMNELIDKNAAEDEENERFAAETKEFSNNLGKPIEITSALALRSKTALALESKSALALESKSPLALESRPALALEMSNEQSAELNPENSQEPVLIDDLEMTFAENSPIETQESESNSENEIAQAVTAYAENIGIKSEELAANQEFLSLSQEQQKFVLETLRRSSFAKARVEANESFNKEKASKKFWQIGFSINQKYHKERHKIEAVKNIESQGLAGYGQTEFAWLIEVVKNGPEVKMDDQGNTTVNCLHENSFNEQQKVLVSAYNDKARSYIEKKADSKNNESEINSLNNLKNELLQTVGSEEEQAALIYKFLEAEKNINLLKFLSANKDAEKMIDKMSNTSLTGFTKARKIIGGQKDKIGYSALGFTVRTGSKVALANSVVLANALSYAAAPIVASLIGGFRAYNQGRSELKEKDELSKLGVEDKSETAKHMNLAVGKKESQNGSEINFGLSNKLDALTSKLEKLQQEGASSKELQEVESALADRIYFTLNKMGKNSISYGTPTERGANYMELTNALAKAQIALNFNASVLENSSGNLLDGKTSSGVKKLTRYDKPADLVRADDESEEDYSQRTAKYVEWLKDEKRLAELKELTPLTRLNSFLNYNEDKQKDKEFNFLAKKVAMGAVIGAGFAATAAFVAEHSGFSSWMQEHVKLGEIKNGVSGFLKNIWSHEDSVKAALPVEKTAHINIKASENIVSKPEVANNTTATNLKTAENVVNKTETVKTSIASKYVDQISNKELNGKHDSVWRSTREIFKSHSQELGYKGDVNDHTALNRWAETQTANAIHNSVDVNDRIFEGNKVELIRDGDHFEVKVDQGTGMKPQPLDDVARQVAPKPVIADNNLEATNNNPSANNVPPKEVLNQGNLTDDQKLIDRTNGSFGQNNLESVPTKDMAGSVDNLDSSLKEYTPYEEAFVSKALHLNPNNLTHSGEHFFYKGQGKGEMYFTLKNGTINIERFYNNAGRPVPSTFFEELRGRTPVDRFIGRNFDKIFTSWDKLSINDQAIYNNLNLFKHNALSPSVLLNKITEVYKVDASSVSVGNSQFILENGKSFDMTFSGIKKLAKYLTKK